MKKRGFALLLILALNISLHNALGFQLSATLPGGFTKSSRCEGYFPSLGSTSEYSASAWNFFNNEEAVPKIVSLHCEESSRRYLIKIYDLRFLAHRIPEEYLELKKVQLEIKKLLSGTLIDCSPRSITYKRPIREEGGKTRCEDGDFGFKIKINDISEVNYYAQNDEENRLCVFSTRPERSQVNVIVDFSIGIKKDGDWIFYDNEEELRAALCESSETQIGEASSAAGETQSGTQAVGPGELIEEAAGAPGETQALFANIFERLIKEIERLYNVFYGSR